ncbi:hypothetical protein ACHAXT_004389 [Thalassiosira profunda]
MTPPSAAPAAAAPATTTRACVKNLPPSLTAAKLQAHLRSARPELRITDCRLLTTKDGKSRKIAFVGFATPAMAETAVRYFDRSYVGTSRLSVSLAFSKKNGPEGREGYRPWSKHSVGSSRYAQLHPQQEEGGKGAVGKKPNAADGDGEDEKEDVDEERNRKRDEFLSAMGLATSKKDAGKAAAKSKFWANDDAVADPVEAIAASKGNRENRDEDGSESDSDGSSSSSSSDSSSDSDGDDDDKAAGEKAEKTKATSDLDFLRSKQVEADDLADESGGEDGSGSSSDSDDSSSSDSDDSSSEDEGKAVASKGGDPPSTDIAASSSTTGERDEPAGNASTGEAALNDRLFVRNLPFTTTEEDLHETFSQFGAVTSVHIPVDDSKRNKGYAFIAFERKEDARSAMETMDGEDFQGRLIHILPARPAVDHAKDIDDPNLTYKERQALARQKEADKASQGWSASFLRGDAVADNLSDWLGVDKGDVLNVKDGISSGNAAVRLALGETHIISENMAFFEEHGVDVAALESKPKGKKGGTGAAKRSKTLILVKNLPYDTAYEDLTKVFHGIGGDVPVRIALPPSKTAALVEYGHPTDARRAFRRLAYRKFKHVPLYLEWAPMREGGAIRATVGEGDASNDDGQKQNETNTDVVGKRQLVDEDASAEAADPGMSQTIYVKNLNFSTSEETLERAFAKAGFQPRAVKIPTKAAPVKKSKGPAVNADLNDTKQLSLGFGFVEFPSEEEATKAMKSLQGKIVDGHALEIKLSTKSLSSSSRAPPTNDNESQSTKIMVRNVPFEATRSEILRLFGAFGQLKRVRLPKKFDGTHRGFAFVEFVTKKEAAKAMAALARTHLYGRHLVLEYAAAETEGGGGTDVEAAREKAKRDAQQAGLGGVGAGGKKKRKHLKF